ncbi:MAG TPA: glycosyltransferase [Longimicrobiales bacterium]|nr:glycosyltransferase [Longimicrobiales bacterium]
MRLLYLNHNVVGTGTYQRASSLAHELAARGHAVTLVTTSGGRRLSACERQADGVRIIEAPDLLAGPARNGWDGWNAGWRVRRLARERFDLIHAFDCRPAVILPALAQRQRDGAALFLDWADWWGRGGTIQERSGWAVRTFFGPIETWFEEHFRTAATANTTISEPLRQRCIALGVPADQVLALPNGCAAPAQRPVDRDAARRHLGVGREPLIAHAGVAQRADATLLFDSFRLLQRDVRDARLVLIGNFRAGVPADLRDAVTRAGFVDTTTLHAWLAAADIGVIPLRDTVAARARWPGKINDYLTAGLPAVLPRVGAAAAYIERGGAGVTCAAEATSLAAAMATALRDDAARAAMSRAARALAAGELAWPRIADALDTFYGRHASGAAAQHRFTVSAT